MPQKNPFAINDDAEEKWTRCAPKPHSGWLFALIYDDKKRLIELSQTPGRQDDSATRPDIRAMKRAGSSKSGECKGMMGITKRIAADIAACSSPTCCGIDRLESLSAADHAQQTGTRRRGGLLPREIRFASGIVSAFPSGRIAHIRGHTRIFYAPNE